MVKAARSAFVNARDNPPHPTWQWIFATIIGILVAVLGWVAVELTDLHSDLGVLNREVGESIALQKQHRENHPNEAIERDVDSLEGRVRNLEIEQARPRPPL